jgi:hypothetical protein
MSVADVLFSEDAQRAFLRRVLHAFQEVASDPTGTVPLLGSTKSFATDNPPTRKRRKPCTYYTTATLVCESLSKTGPVNGFEQAAAHFQWLLATPHQNPMQLTWGVLIALYLSDALKDLVCAHTSAEIARAYLEHFDTRFEAYLCGQLQYDKHKKTSCLVRQAKTPTEIVLHEWQYAKHILTDPLHYQ